MIYFHFQERLPRNPRGEITKANERSCNFTPKHVEKGMNSSTSQLKTSEGKIQETLGAGEIGSQI